jgi:hypothetical protein
VKCCSDSSVMTTRKALQKQSVLAAQGGVPESDERRSLILRAKRKSHFTLGDFEKFGMAVFRGPLGCISGTAGRDRCAFSRHEAHVGHRPGRTFDGRSLRGDDGLSIFSMNVRSRAADPRLAPLWVASWPTSKS